MLWAPGRRLCRCRLPARRAVAHHYGPGPPLSSENISRRRAPGPTRSILLLDPPRRLPPRCHRLDAPLFHQLEVDLAVLDAGLHHHDVDAIAEPELTPGALAGQRLADRVEMVIVVRQLGHVDQAVDLGFVQLHEQSETGHAADRALELAADVLLHPGRPVTLVDLALGLVRTALALRALQRQ